MLDGLKCYVYNANYEPLRVAPAIDAFMLVLKGRATALKNHDTIMINSAHAKYPVPIRIVLHEYKKNPIKANAPAKVNNHHLFMRDNYTCQYCGRHASQLNKKKQERLTRDHLHPKSLGGGNEWLNLVTACSRCNNKKGNALLHDTELKLARQPRILTNLDLWILKEKMVDKFIGGGE